MIPNYTKIDQPDIIERLFAPQPDKDFKWPETLGVTIAVPVDSNISLRCQLLAEDIDAPILCLFPNPHSSAGDLATIVQAYHRHGLNIIVVSYRGCFGNKGKPSFQAIATDSPTLIQTLRSELQDRGLTNDLFLLGSGLGNIGVLHLAGMPEMQIKGIIIESGMYETLPFLRKYGIDPDSYQLTEENGFNLCSLVQQVTVPVLIFHASQDDIVTIAEAEQLQVSCGAKNKQFFVIPRAQRDSIPQAAGELYFQTIKKHIDKICGVTAWQYKKKQRKI